MREFTWVIRYQGRLGEATAVFTISENEMEKIEEWADKLPKGWYWEYISAGGTFEKAKELVNNWEMHEKMLRERYGEAPEP